LRRILVIGTALFVLVAAASAYAAINTYTAKLGFTSKQAGTAKKPVPIGYTQDLKASGTNGNRTAVLLDIKTKIYGLTENATGLPTCTLNTIATAHNDSGCPKGALVATGYITAVVAAANNFTAPGAACDPTLDVWNGGPGKLTFFFVDTPTHLCLGGALKTGSTPPYPATYKQSGKFLVVDVPVPHAISFPVSGEAGSLVTEHLNWLKKTTKVKGKTVASIASVACQGAKRPYSTSFTATLPTAGPAKESKTLSASAPC
jgi:hypothetical protein